MDLNVLFLTLYGRKGGSSRIRVYQFVPFLEEKGIGCEIRSLVPDKLYDELTISFSRQTSFLQQILPLTKLSLKILKRIIDILTSYKYDVVFIQKEVMPLFLRWPLKWINSKIVYEYDDAIFEVTPSKTSGILSRILFPIRARLLLKMFKISRCVIAENPYLENYAQRFTDWVEVIAAPIDTTQYIPINKRENNKKCVLGWIGSEATLYLLELLKPVLERLACSNPSACLKIIGAKDFSVKGMEVELVRWSESTQISELADMDIGLMPLDNQPFNKGKLGYKLVQYMSVGIPVVASNLGLNSFAITHGLTGYLTKTEDEWVEYLERLIKSPELRRELGQSGREEVVKRFDLRNQADKLAEILNKVADSE